LGNILYSIQDVSGASDFDSLRGLRQSDTLKTIPTINTKHHRIHQALGYTTPRENYRPEGGLATAA